MANNLVALLVAQHLVDQLRANLAVEASWIEAEVEACTPPCSFQPVTHLIRFQCSAWADLTAIHCRLPVARHVSQEYLVTGDEGEKDPAFGRHRWKHALKTVSHKVGMEGVVGDG